MPMSTEADEHKVSAAWQLGMLNGVIVDQHFAQRGRMGRLVCRAVADDPDLALVAGISPSTDGELLGPMIGRPDVDVMISDTLDTLSQAETEVAVDFTTPSVVMDNVRWAIDHGVHIVVGTTGIGSAQLDEIRRSLDDEGNESNVIVAPNFAIGAVLMQRFSAEAALYLPAVEIIELHHDGKVDAPSGTALTTAARMGGDIPIHSVRLPGIVANQEVILGARGQTLTLRHDTTSRDAFVPGILLAVRRIRELPPGLTSGLEAIL